MVHDSVHCASLYFSLHPLFERAFSWLQNEFRPEMADGYYSIEGERLQVALESEET